MGEVWKKSGVMREHKGTQWVCVMSEGLGILKLLECLEAFNSSKPKEEYGSKILIPADVSAYLDLANWKTFIV